MVVYQFMIIEICNLVKHCIFNVNLGPLHSFVPDICTRDSCRNMVLPKRYGTIKIMNPESTENTTPCLVVTKTARAAFIHRK